MGATLYNTSPRFKNVLDEYETHCTACGLSSFLGIIQGTLDIADARPRQVQLAIVALELALARFLQDLGLKPDLVIGHSLGEYAALCVAGVLSVSDTLHLAHERAALMERHCIAGEYGVLAVPLGADETRTLLRETNSSCEICCLNSPSHTVISGPSDKLQVLGEVLEKKGVKPTRLNVPYAFHSQQMDNLLPDFKQLAENVQFNNPNIPVASTLTGTIVEFEGTFNSSYLAEQCRQPVNFIGALKTSEAHGKISNDTVVLEIGPHPICTSLLVSCLPHLELVTLSTLRREHSDLEGLSNCLATAYVHHRKMGWEIFHKDYADSLSLVSLPSYAFDTTDYWIPYQTQTVSDKSGMDDEPSRQRLEIPTVTLQRLEYMSEDRMSATFISHVREPSLLQTIQGHAVDGAAICPASIFIDMACGAAQRLLSSNIERDTPSKCVDLSMTSPLTISDDPDQTIRVKAQVHTDRKAVKIQIGSTAHGTSTEHASCEILLQDSDTSIWPQIQRLVQLRVDTLSHASSGESGHHKIIVEYSSPFRILDNVSVDKEFQDAVAEIRVPPSTDQGAFTSDLFSVDALIHLPGFLLNCNFDKPKEDIHIAKSVGKVVILESFRRGVRPLTLYASISRSTDADGTTVCDAYLFKDGELVALVSGICFHRISRHSFSMLTGGNSLPQYLQSPRGNLALQDANSSPGNERPIYGGGGIWLNLLQTVATTTGVNIVKVKSATTFTELGVDSHMAISIISEIRRDTGVILPAAFFNNFPRVAEAKFELEKKNQGSPTPTSTTTSTTSSGNTPVGRAILLQGKPSSPNPPLFLVTESSGSITVYTHFPPLPHGTPIYGLESPFLSNPKDNTIPPPALARCYIATMRTIQPTGPYLLAGYSFAAVYAKEMAYQLALTGERLLGLVVIDMYVPPPAHNGSSDMKRFSLDGIGQGPLANITTRISQMFPTFTDNQKEHMRGSMQAASLYTPAPIAAGLEPHQTHLVWAKRGVNENGNPDEIDPGLPEFAWIGGCEEGRGWEGLSEEEMGMLLRSWFFAPRRGFGTNGWETLVGEGITVHTVDADHLSLVAPPKVLELGGVIARAVEACTNNGT
ncbi:hypothetical protein BJX70DRAFT_394305 [Aspergillus crustosus]